MLKRLVRVLLKQYSIGVSVGGVKDLLQRSLFYVTAINFFLLIITSWGIILRDHIAQYISWFTFPVFVGLLVFVILFAMLIEYKFILPATWKFINRQRYQHGEPLKSDLQKVLDRLDRIEKALGVKNGGNDSKDETDMPTKP